MTDPRQATETAPTELEVERLTRLPPDQVVHAARIDGFDVVFGPELGNDSGGGVERVRRRADGPGAQPRNPHSN